MIPIYKAIMETIIKDDNFRLAERYVEETSVSLFLTGKAGTGKTTFLRYIVENTTKRCVVLAPTGVAAVNAQGSTIHSFFSLPLCPYLPDVTELMNEYQMPERYRRLRKDRIKIIRTLDLLIIDEISMVRADMLDAVDMTLRRYRRSEEPFGGVQLLMIGDARQLSPVVTDAEKPYISKVYASPYFFHSKALRKLPYLTIELNTIYRQEDREFISLLNAVRDARVSEEALRRLNSRVGAPAGEDWIRLTTHNSQADRINFEKLEALDGEVTTFEAEVEGDYPETIFPASQFLSLKRGTRVMFIRNDQEGRFYNGKLGTVENLDDGDVIVVRDDDGNEIRLERAEWENLQYSLDKSSGEIVQEVKGTFRQFPLRPAWAITIHKSQGLTFDHVIIDAGSAFAFGQVYVALSRCRSLEGISLSRPLAATLLMRDEHVSSFNDSLAGSRASSEMLEDFRKDYAFNLLCSCFSFGELRRQIFTLRKYWRDSALGSIYPAQMESLEKSAAEVAALEETAGKFRRQLSSLRKDPEATALRISKACEYFLPRIEALGVSGILAVEIDNAEVLKRIKTLSEDLLPQLQAHIDTLRNVMDEGFDAKAYRQVRSRALLWEKGKPARPKRQNVSARDIYKGNRHPELVPKLVAWRRERAAEQNVPAYVILHQKTLLGIADAKPSSREEMLTVKGFGERLWEKFGAEILEVISGEASSGG